LTVGAANGSGTFSGTIKNGDLGPLALTKSGTGTQVLSGNNTYTGGTVVNGGTLLLSGSLASNSPITVNSGGTFTNGRGDIWGDSNTTTVGPAFTINGGTLASGNGFFLPITGGVTLNNGTILLNGGANSTYPSFGLQGTMTVYGNSSVTVGGGSNNGIRIGGAITDTLTVNTVNASDTLTWNGVVSGDRLAKSGGGTLTLTGANTYAGATAINAGTLAVAPTGRLGNGDYSGAITNNGAFLYSGTNNQILRGVISGSGSLTHSGSGTLTLSGINTYTGGTVVNGGTLLLTGSLALNSPITVNSGGTFTNGRGDIWGNSDTTTVGPAFAINGGTLASGNGFFLPITGGVTLNNGTILLNGGANVTFPSFGLQGTMTVYGNSSVTVGAGSNNGIRIGGAITDTLTVNTVNAADTLTWNGVVSGDRLAKSGGGTLTLTGANTYTGATAINAGTLAIASTGRLGNGDYFGNITNAGAFIYSGTNEQILRGVVSGSGSLTHSGLGALTLFGTNTYTGATRVDLGELRLGNGGSLGATDVMVGSGLTPTATAGHATFAVFGNSTLGTGTGGTLTITGGNTGGSPVGQGTLSLQDGTLNTLTLANTTDGATNLVLGGTVGNAALLRLDVGASGVDLIAAGQRLTLNPGGAVVNLNALAGPALGLGTYDFLTYASDSALQGTLSFAGGLTTVPWGGGRSLTLQTTPTAARLVVAAVNAPANACWTGSQSAVWAALDGSNQTNWVDAPAGVNTQQLPGLTTNVFFTANSAGNLNTTLGQDFAVNSLNFTAGAGAAVISGNTLTLFGTGSNGNTAGNGISVAAGSGAHTIASDVVVGGDQTWTNGSVNALTVSGSLGGAAGIGLNGAFVFSGTAGNTFTGTLTVGPGSLTLSKTAGVDAVAGGLVVTGGTVNWSAANQMNDTSAVTVNGGSLALGGFDETVGAVSLVDGAITGSGVLNGSGFAVQSGTVSARLGGPGAALTKTGPGTVTLNTAAVYTGATEVRDGTLLLNGVGLGATAVTLGSGAATTGTLRVAGDVTLGTATGGSLTILGGTGGGVLSLEDGAINTLTLANGGATLTAGGAPGQDARVTLELSNTTTDRITVAGRMALNAGGLTLGLSQLAGTSLENGTYDLMRFAAGPGAGAPVGFAGGLSSIPVGGGRSFTLQTTAEAVQLLVRSVAYPGALFWSGAQNGNWSSLGSNNETNWVDGVTGTNTQQIPGPTSNVYFTAVGALNSGASVLGMDLAINSLNFNATASGPVGISGHTLTLYATNANGNVAGSGLTVEAGSGAHTISSALILGGDQGWWNYSSNPLTVSGVIQGSNTLGLTGKFTWSGAAANTLSGRTTLQTGTLALAKNAGVNAVAGDLLVNGGTVQWQASEQIADTSRVTVDGGALALGAQNETVAELILRSGTITGDGALVAGSYTVESGSIRAALAGPGASFLKTGTGTAVLSGANTFAGGARLEGGTVHVEVSNTGAVSGAFGPAIQSISVHPVQNDAALLLNGAHTLANPIAVFAGGGAGVTLGGAHAAGTGVFSGDIALGRDAVLASAGGDVEFRGAFSGMGGATVRATTGRVLFAGSAANTHTGLTTLESGTLVLAKTGGAWAVPGDVTINGGRLEFAGNHQIVDTATLRVNAGTVDVRGFTETVKDLVITGGTVTGGALRVSAGVDARAGVLDVGLAGAVPLDKTTGGVTELRGSSPNTFSGLTSVAAGTLLLNKDNGVTAITGDGRADVVVPDVVIRGGSLRSAANGQLDPTVTLLMTSGGLDLNGKTETIFDFTNSGGVFRTGAGGKLTVTSLNTTTWSGGSNTVNTGGSLTTPHLVIRGGLNVVETGGVLNVGNGSAAGGELEFSNGGSLVLQSGTAAPGRLVLSDDVTVSGLGGGLVTSGTGTKPGVVDLGGTRLITVSDAAEFSVTASLDNGALRKAGAGTLTLSGANTHAGGTVIDAGAVVLGHARGFGVGDVRLNDAILRMSGETLQARIGGNYIQGAGGILQLRVSRGNGGALMSDSLLVTGRAELGGALHLTSPGRVQLRLGERVILVEAGGGVAGAFSEIRNELQTNTIVQPTVTQESRAVVLEGELGSFSRYAAASGLTPNQRATAAALDRVAFDSRETRLIGALSELPLETLPSTLDRIAPEELSAVYQQAVASARAQSWNLQQRLREARSGWRGFSSAGLRSRDGRGEAKAVPGGALLGGAGVANLSARLSDLAVNQTREAADAGKAWTFFINGELEWVDIDSTANARGYDLQSSGVSVGADFLASENLVLGLTTGYSRGDAELAGGGRLKMEGGSQFGAYAGYFKDGFHADGIVGGGMSAYEIRRAGFGGNARGDTDGREFHMELSGGKDWRVGRITFGPEVSLRYAWAGLQGYTERGSLAPLRIESQDAHSLQFEVGGHAAYAWKVGSVVVTPEVRMFWQHETLEDSPWVASRFASGAGGVFRVRGPQVGRDSLVGSGSVTVQLGEKWSGYAAYTGEFLRVNSATHRVNVGLRMEF
jgi:autotransporter-associated beta strand protein